MKVALDIPTQVDIGDRAALERLRGEFLAAVDLCDMFLLRLDSTPLSDVVAAAEAPAAKPETSATSAQCHFSGSVSAALMEFAEKAGKPFSVFDACLAMPQFSKGAIQSALFDRFQSGELRKPARGVYAHTTVPTGVPCTPSTLAPKEPHAPRIATPQAAQCSSGPVPRSPAVAALAALQAASHPSSVVKPLHAEPEPPPGSVAAVLADNHTAMRHAVPCSPAGAAVGRTMAPRFTMTDLEARVGRERCGHWLSSWVAAGWVKRDGLSDFVRTEKFPK